MSALQAAPIRRAGALACAVAAVALIAGCGKSNTPASAENDGVYVTAGPITYQLQISRQLNEYSVEDRQYVAGLPRGARPTLGPNALWYGVFLWAKNQTQRPATTSDNFDIVDTEGAHYYPLRLDPALNPYAWTAQSLAPGEIEPAPDTTASFGPTQGRLLLFRLNSSVYDNRPLNLEIKGPTGKVWGTIALDL